MRTSVTLLSVFLGLAGMLTGTAVAVNIETVPVGNPGNAGDTRYANPPYTPPNYGAIGYTYNIGKYEVTNSQYAEFLNAVAGSDPHDLYSTAMGSDYGGITRSGSPGNYAYNTRAGRGNMPVNYVSWYDALRFANWVHNGATPGADTEDGAYDMSLGGGVARKPGALVFLPSEDEWYKAAYYKGGGTSGGYWDYPTQSDTPPTAEAPPGTDLVNGSANYSSAVGDVTSVGAYNAKPSDGAYGTFDQCGNVWEWNETTIGDNRGVRGGMFNSNAQNLHASYRSASSGPTAEWGWIGFRVAEVPEPAPLLLLALGGLAVMRRRS